MNVVNNPYEEGRATGHAAKDLTELSKNPYAQGHPEYLRWSDGFLFEYSQTP